MKKFFSLNGFLNKKFDVNYLYFGPFFLFLLATTIWRIHTLSFFSVSPSHYFLLYGALQALFEILGLILVMILFERFTPKWCAHCIVGLTFVLLLTHVANFTLIRLMDVTLSYFFAFFFGNGLHHFLTAFLAMNMSVMMVGLIVGILAIVPTIGVFFYRWVEKLTKRKPFRVSFYQTLVTWVALASTMLILDVSQTKELPIVQYQQYRKALPFCFTFLSPAMRPITLSKPLPSAREETELQNQLKALTFSIEKKPNIYLIIIEALRRDYIDEQTAPCMSALLTESIAPSFSFSNANTTHLSWFSIFHSIFPYNYTTIRDSWSKGSIPLQLLKKCGYQICVYTSADLSYFNMDEMIFGHDRQLIDSIKDFSMQKELNPCDRDAKMIDSLMHNLSDHPSGTLHILFFDSTHSEYSIPSDFPQPFQPSLSSINYLFLSPQSPDLAMIQNRYRNAIFWVDHLVGRLVHHLQKENLYEDALIVLTGDHGEEFFEDRALFHGSHLNRFQTNVPIFYKIPSLAFPPVMSSHLDIFPTLLHTITGLSDWDNWMDGQSIFLKKRKPFLLSVQHNGHYPPTELTLFNQNMRLNIHIPRLLHLDELEVNSSEKIDHFQEILHAEFQ